MHARASLWLDDSLRNDCGAQCWVVFPDRKEVELARDAWPGKVYQRASVASLAATLAHAAPGEASSSGTYFGAVQKLTSLFGDKADKAVFGDRAAEEAWSLECDPAQLILCVQPGEGGPLEVSGRLVLEPGSHEHRCPPLARRAEGLVECREALRGDRRQ